MDTIGKRIKFLREKHHLSQTELAQILNVSNKSVSAWERDDKEPRMGAIEKMAVYFGVRKTDIIDGSIYLYKPTHFTPTKEEEEMIMSCRDLDEKHQKMLKSYIKFLMYDQLSK